MTRSAASPAAMRFWTSGVLDHAAETLWPVAFSNSGINSRYASFVAEEARSKEFDFSSLGHARQEQTCHGDNKSHFHENPPSETDAPDDG